jgi:hypothetical protein
LFKGFVSLGRTRSVKVVLDSSGVLACIAKIFGKGKVLWRTIEVNALLKKLAVISDLLAEK